MRIVIITPERLAIPVEAGGSIQIYVQELYQALLFATKKKATHDDTNAAVNTNSMDIKLISPQGNGKLHKENHITFPGSNLDEYRKQILGYLRNAQPEIIQVENRPDFALRLQREFPSAKIILNLHSTTFLKKRHISQEDAEAILTNCHRIIVNSHYLNRQIHTKFNVTRTAHAPFRVIYPGVNLNTFPQKPLTRSHSFSRRRPLNILFVGRIIPQKGLDVLLAAVQELHKQHLPVHLTVVGKGHAWSRKYEERLKKSARGFPVVFHGFVPPRDLPLYYAKADVFACPSQKNEAFGMVNLEALASGLPVVGSRVGGIQEIVTENCGILVQHFHRTQAWKRHFTAFIRNPKRYQRLRRNTRQRAERFTWNHTARHFIALYQDLANSE